MLLLFQIGLPLSTILTSVMSWRVSQDWNPCQIQLNPGAWSMWLSKASVNVLKSLHWCHWCCLSSVWSSWRCSPCRRLWRLCWDAQQILVFILPLLLSHQCPQQSRDQWLFCLQCWQCLHDLLQHLSRSFPEISWRWWVRVDIQLQLCMKPVPYAATEEDCTGGLVTEVFDDLDKVGTDVILLHGCPQSWMPNPESSEQQTVQRI